MSSLKEDTHFIKTMMSEMYDVFKGQSSSSVTPTLALTYILANIKRENATNTTTEKPPSYIEGETEHPKIAVLISSIQPTELDEDPLKKLVPASTIVRPDPDEDVKVPYMINGKMCYLTDKEMQAYLDREEKLKKAAEEEILLAISSLSAKAGEKFKKAQDAEHEVLKRLHTEKVNKSLELRKHKFENYIGTDGINFDVHKPFAFGAFGIFELDDPREIIPKKKNVVVQDLMNSLSRRYERIRKILEELGIKSALSTFPAPEQASSKSSRKKRKHMELEPEIKIPGLECNRALPENVPFVNNMVIEKPEHGIFFTDEFGDQAFQRWSDIDKVEMEALVSYLVAASMV
ncbi:hypothetical protein Tco_0941470 [Tanacetum coccineum]|uniref:Uncharacterized protein n=1 Tax=Tanacetum coccineum TaxID=301880 RepID=A0ABQ5DRF1_9ASTR